MKIKLELFGASKDLSNKEFLELNIKENISIKYHPVFNELSQSGVDIVMKCKIVVNN